MAKAKKDKMKITLGDMAFVGIILVAAGAAYFTVPASYSYVPTLLLGLFGAILAIINIQREEETRFLISVIGLVVVTTVLLLINLPTEASMFLVNLSVGFGIAGFIVALGNIVKLGWGK